MFRIKMALKAALVPAIIGIVALIAGIILILVGALIENGGGAIIAGIIIFVIGIAFFVIAYAQAKSRLHAICPECQKFMGDADATVKYSFVCNQYRENYDKSTNQFKDFTFYYTCTIVCPHCGSSSMFDYNVNAKTEPKANAMVDKYLKDILKLKK